MKTLIAIICTQFLISNFAFAQGVPKISAGGGMGLQGHAGAGFADFTTQSPEADFKMDRGVFATVGIERGFNVMNLYLTLSLSNLQANGLSKYQYTNLSNSNSYSANDVKFSDSILDLGLGLKIKLIDKYWFRPYVEGGGLGGYHAINYTSKLETLAAQGNDYKGKDQVMGSGYYAEGGLEAMFSDRFGLKLGARRSNYETKALETLANRALKFSVETYYFSLLFGM